MANIERSAANQRIITAYASAARTATPDTVELVDLSARALYVVIDVTAVTATPSVTFAIQGVDSVSGKAFAILTSAAITAVGTTVLRIGPGLTAAANVTANDNVPPRVRIVPTHGDADSITYTVGVLKAV
jgi:hypothetical protein